MISKIDKNAVRQRRHARVRKTITGTAETPRMNVYRSLNHIYVQVIDDRAGNEKGGVTLAAASTMDKAVKEKIQGLNKTDAAKVVGAIAAEKAMAKGVETVVFDRGGYLYTGRVKAVADGAREAGLKF
ncbi:MAG: 50S ribosomal protein L18 [Clostridiales bacterium]|nr:50S ribosomal protein L18 [Clostridiales bacterium]